MTGIVCDLNRCEKFIGSAFQRIFFHGYTSGLFLLFGIVATYTLIHQLSIEWVIGSTAVYAYATFVTICAVISLTGIAWVSRLNIQNNILLILTWSLVLFILPFSGDRIVGEYLSSLLLLIGNCCLLSIYKFSFCFRPYCDFSCSWFGRWNKDEFAFYSHVFTVARIPWRLEALEISDY